MNENKCSACVFVAIIFLLGMWFTVRELSVESGYIAGILLIEFLLIQVFCTTGKSFTWDSSNYRPQASATLSFVFLVPLALLGDIASAQNTKDALDLEDEILCSLSVASVIIAHYFYHCNSSYGLLLLTVVLFTIPSFLLTSLWLSILRGICLPLIWKCLDLIPAALPKSFSYAEVAIVIQLVVNWIFRLNQALFKLDTFSEDNFIMGMITATLMISVSAATLTVYVSGSYYSLHRFTTVYIVFAGLSIAFLHFQLSEQPVLWIINFVSSKHTRVILLAMWSILLFITLIWTRMYGLSHIKPCKESDKSGQAFGECTKDSNSSIDNFKGSSSPPSNTSERSDDQGKISFMSRKVFHVLIVLVYIPGLILDPYLLFLASVSMFGLFIILEAARALQVPIFGEYLDNILRTFVDDRDQGPVFLTHIYLLVGVSLPLWISHNGFYDNTSSLVLYSGVLSLGVGDTLACVAGKVWGTRKWSGTQKTIEGTFCSIQIQMILIYLGATLDFVSVKNPVAASLGIVISALVEAFTDQIDNLILPLVLYPFLCIR